MSKFVIHLLLLNIFLVTFWPNAASAIAIDKYPKLMEVADQLIAENHYTQDELTEIFQKAQFQQSVLDAMQSPAEYKLTWGKYRKLFLQEDRINQGADFWEKYSEDLARAQERYGVPASVIVAIIGVESKYGKYKGKHKVLDSLITLVIGFERRSKFFASELKQFLILTKENNLEVENVMGSYAGAVGFPQFISSSYRNYAVDFSGDGVIDLINQPVDAIGSIANYFVENGWLKGEPVTSGVHKNVPKSIAAIASNKRKVQHLAGNLRSMGVPLSNTIDNSEKLGVIELNASEVVPQAKDKKTYIVRAGDTACEIAEAHLVACKALIKLNKLKRNGAIYRGQKLKIPSELRADVAKSLAENKKQNSHKTNSGKWAVSSTSKSNNSSTATFKENSNDEILHYFFTHENFYVITRYNQSVLYAMAVHDLSVAIEAAKNNLLRVSKANSQ